MAKKRAQDLTAETSYEDYYPSKRKQPGMLDPAYLIPRILGRWHWLLLGLLLGLVWGFFQVKRSVPLYQSTATLMVRDWNVTVMGKFDPTDIDLRGKEAVEMVRADFDRSQLFEQVAADPLVRDLSDLIPKEAPSLLDTFSSSNTDAPLISEAPPSAILANMIRSWTQSDVIPESRFITVSVIHTLSLIHI